MRLYRITNPHPVCHFSPGNELSKACNLSDASNYKRIKGLMRGWAATARKRRGERIMTAAAKKKVERRQRVRLIENIQTEARDIQNQARGMATEAMEVMANLMRHSPKGSDRVAAASIILERAYAKATQTNVNAKLNADGKPTEVTSKELDTRITEAVQRVESITGGAPEAEGGEGEAAHLRIDDSDTGGLLRPLMVMTKLRFS